MSQRVFKEMEGVNERQTTRGLPFHISKLTYFDTWCEITNRTFSSLINLPNEKNSVAFDQSPSSLHVLLYLVSPHSSYYPFFIVQIPFLESLIAP